MTAIVYTPSDVERWIDAPVLQKARINALSVSSAKWDGQNLTGDVCVSSDSQFRVHAYFDRDPDQQLVVRGICTCKDKRNCEHVAALLLSESRPADFTAQAVAPSVRPEVADWLEGYSRRRSPAPTGLREVPRVPSRQASVIYVLSELEDRWAMLVFKARIGTRGIVSIETNWSGASIDEVTRTEDVADTDREILEIMAPRRLGEHLHTREPFWPYGGEGADVFNLIIATGRFYFDRSRPADRQYDFVRLSPGRPRSGVIQWADGGRRPFLSTRPKSNLVWLSTEPAWYFDTDQQVAGPVKLPLPVARLRTILSMPALNESEVDAVTFLLQEISPDLPVSRPEGRPEIEVIESPARGQLTLDTIRVHQSRFGDITVGNQLDVAAVRFVYGSISIAAESGPSLYRKADGSLVKVQRQRGAETALVFELNSRGLERIPENTVYPASSLPAFAFGFKEPDEWQTFVNDIVPELRAAGWDVTISPSFRHNVIEVDTFSASVHSIEDGWLEIEMGIIVSGRRIRLEPLLNKLFASDRRWLNGLLSEIRDDEIVELRTDEGQRLRFPSSRLKPLVQNLVDLLHRYSGDTIRVSVLDAVRLQALEDTLRWEFHGDESVRVLARKLLDSAGVRQIPAPAGLNGTLRSYQQEGLNWLQFLREMNLGGILADDMGLGKTLQTLAHVLVEKLARRLERPALVIVPKTLVSNWVEEAQHFTPQLTVLPLDGPARRERFGEIDKHDLIITTYALLPRDETLLLQHNYHLLVLDEAQYVRNATTKASAAIRRLKATHRLCLTGTPIENQLLDLWSQFDFLLPGFLGGRRDFTQRFNTPITSLQGDPVRAAILRGRTSPFILRRKKEDVEKELPPKVIALRTVELQGAQRDLYETVRAAQEATVRKAIESVGMARSSIIVLDALLKLREVCCDPRLVKIPGAAKVTESAKLSLLTEMLQQLVAEGRRVLVVSFFASMLALIEQELRRLDIDFVKLTGDSTTSQRLTSRKRFQAGDVPVFLISLKAGGVGLNLTAADTVIHYDPWWNPAAEAQATDRAHRIGQTKTLFVYKLVVAGSIEERVVALQEKKAALADMILECDGAGKSKFTQKDIEALLAPLRDPKGDEGT